MVKAAIPLLPPAPSSAAAHHSLFILYTVKILLTIEVTLSFGINQSVRQAFSLPLFAVFDSDS